MQKPNRVNPRRAHLRVLAFLPVGTKFYNSKYALRGLKTFRPIAPTATKKRYDTSCQGGDLPRLFVANTTLIAWGIVLKRLARV